MEASITLGITISIIITLQPGITETPRVMDTGKAVLFLSAMRLLNSVSWVLDSVLLGKLQ